MSLISLDPYVSGKGGGFPDVIDVGSGVAQPRGIESILQFNGLTLNDRKRLDTYLVTQIDGLADPDVRDSRDVNPGRHGETAFDAYYGGRTIVLTGKVRGNTIRKLRDMQQALKEAFGDLSRELPLLIGAENAENGVYINCRKSQPIAMSELQADYTYRRDFQVTLRASNPRFLSYDQEWINWHGTMVPGEVKGVLTINNLGNFPAEPIIRIDGPVLAATTGGPALKLSTVTDTHGVIARQSFIINAKPGTDVAIPDGSYFELDVANRTLVEVGANRTIAGTNVFSQLDIASDTLEFQPGETSLELTTYGASDPHLLVRYRHTYL